MRLLFQLPFKGDIEDPIWKPYIKLLERGWESVRRADTEIVVRALDQGMSDHEHFNYSALRFFNEREILKSIIKARKEFDGIIIFCYFDPALRAARSLLNIPVVGAAESSMHLACMMGLRFATISTSPAFIPEMTETLYKYGMQQNAIERNPIRSMTLSILELVGCFTGDFNQVINNFKEIAAGCIEDGAEVLIAGCGVLSPLLTQSGLREVDGVPIIDPALVSIKVAEALVDLHKAGIPIISRKGLYLAPPAETIKEMEKM